MMSDYNRIILTGRLGKDPELRFAGNGTAKASFSMASTYKWKDKDGETQEQTEWTNIVVFGRTAEICKDYLHKGSRVLVDGRKQTRKYTDHYNNERQATEVIAQIVNFLDPREPKTESQKDPGPGDSNYNDDDDLPF
jgi:single-strand DNA-binding protein